MIFINKMYFFSLTFYNFFPPSIIWGIASLESCNMHRNIVTGSALVMTVHPESASHLTWVSLVGKQVPPVTRYIFGKPATTDSCILAMVLHTWTEIIAKFLMHSLQRTRCGQTVDTALGGWCDLTTACTLLVLLLQTQQWQEMASDSCGLCVTIWQVAWRWSIWVMCKKKKKKVIWCLNHHHLYMCDLQLHFFYL